MKRYTAKVTTSQVIDWLRYDDQCIKAAKRLASEYGGDVPLNEVEFLVGANVPEVDVYTIDMAAVADVVDSMALTPEAV